MTTFNWTISVTERAVSLDGLSDVIFAAHWGYTATGETGVTAELFGVTPFGPPNPEDFTPYDSITTAMVEGWLETILSTVPVDEEGNVLGPAPLVLMQSSLEQQIESIVNPTIIVSPLPNEELPAE